MESQNAATYEDDKTYYRNVLFLNSDDKYIYI